MRTLTEKAFLSWAKTRGVCLDQAYPESAVLTFLAGARHDRFWSVPPESEKRPHFLASLMELMGDWQSCYAWRHLGSWPDSAGTGDVNGIVELQILRGINVPLGTDEVVEFGGDELDSLITLLFSTTIFGWSVEEDLYVVPDHARYLLQTDHHRVIHVSFRDSGDVNRWVSVMEERGFPLPKEVPDETFAHPAWMAKSDR